MMEHATLLDAHVHFHPCFDAQAFFDAALSHFERAAHELELRDDTAKALLLTETARDHCFRGWHGSAGRIAGSNWSARSTAEASSFLAQRDDGAKIVVVAGRQIATREGLEVLALCTDREYADGRDLDSTISAVDESGGVPVVPWGFGKWTLRRRARVEALVRLRTPGNLFLGDNSGRLEMSRRPRLFEVAAQRGIWTLPGSDPLPFPSQVQKVGRYGCVLEGAIDEDRPAASLAGFLHGCDVQPRVFGKLESFSNFCVLQVRMQWHKRFGAKA